ncbi:MAG: 50S ribosomal protein L33 [Planctomycetota bacterium]
MAKPKKKKEVVHLVCEDCGDRNYTLLKKPGTPKLSLKKYCRRTRQHTLHNEKKK